MSVLNKQDITNLYVWLDNNLPRLNDPAKGGRPSKLENSELVSILIWNTLIREIVQLYKEAISTKSFTAMD